MATKSITITEEAYKRLKQLRREDESFSQIIQRLTSNAGRLLKFAGALNEKDADRLEKRIQENRKRWMDLEVKRKTELRRQWNGMS